MKKDDSASKTKVTEEFVPGNYSIGLACNLSYTDVQAIFRDAVMRVKQLFTDRLCGRTVDSAETEESRQKLLDGELELLIPPGHTIHMRAQPQVVFKPIRLVIDDEAAEWYDVVDIKVGKNSQLVAVGNLPGTSFRAGVSRTYKMDTAQISMYLTVSLINVSSKPRRVPRAMLDGLSGVFKMTDRIAAGLDLPQL